MCLIFTVEASSVPGHNWSLIKVFIWLECELHIKYYNNLNIYWVLTLSTYSSSYWVLTPLLWCQYSFSSDNFVLGCCSANFDRCTESYKYSGVWPPQTVCCFLIHQTPLFFPFVPFKIFLWFNLFSERCILMT